MHDTTLDSPNGIYDIIFSDKILDNVHGFIYYSEKEREIIDYILFKRLQNIKQLSVVDWIFPCSEHTRYTHSLGVMQIADRMLLQLNQELKKNNLPSFGLKERKIIRFAGLLHDIGHYPLSHVGESAYIKFNDDSFHSIEELISKNNKNLLQEIKNFTIGINTEQMKNRSPIVYHHEAVGARLIQEDAKIVKILIEECGEEAPQIIADIITGNVDRRETNPLLVQIIHSELDADGIDYLMRDAKFSGTSFGTFEVDFLISNLTVGKYGEDNILCIKPKAIAAADQYILNKFFAYSQVVYNKHVDIAEWMAIQLIKWMKNKGIFLSQTKLKDINTYNDEYLLFTDYYFWNKVQEIIDGKHDTISEHIDDIKMLAKHLLEHTEPVCVRKELKIISKNHEEIKKTLQKEVDFDEQPKILYKFLSRKIYNQVPLNVFLQEIRRKNGGEADTREYDEYDINNYEIKTIMKKRLMEGICICDNEDLHLLCDDERSMMRIMYNSTLAILRAYDFNT